MHWVERDWLRRTLEVPCEGPTVVVTHHAPSVGSVAPKYERDWLEPRFWTNLQVDYDLRIAARSSLQGLRLRVKVFSRDH